MITLNYEVNGYNIFLIVLVTFVTSVILVPIIKKVAIHVGALDRPNARRVNKIAMPTLGGLAIFFAFMLGYMLYASRSIQMLSILMGSFILIIFGMVDCINPVKARYRLIVQFVAAAIIVFYGNIVLNDVSIFGHYFEFAQPLNYIITILFIMTITNAINFIDGLDGLASGISSIYFLTIAIIGFILKRSDGLDVILALIMLGSTLGFLVYNFPPAIIYLGDTGSQFLGFIIAVIALLGYKTATFTSLIIPVLILALPLFDIVLAILRRLIKKESIGQADKSHFHHQLLKMNFSAKTSLLIIYFIEILFAAVSILYTLGDIKYAIILYIALMVVFVFIVMTTDILFPKNK